MAKELIKWNKEHFGYVSEKIKQLESQLSKLRANPASPNQVEAEKQVCSLLEEQLCRWDSILTLDNGLITWDREQIGKEFLH